ncbi:MAG: alpha-2-macroglobulin family protein, partial [bacterium]|nr:alpha-2-macroglobulin family protein [bacterium]
MKTVKLAPLPPRLYVSLWDNTKIPGEKAALTLSGAKIQTVQFTAYRVNLIEFLRSGRRFNQLDNNKADPTKLPGTTQVGAWEYNLPEKDILEFDIKVPLKKEEQAWSYQAGLYLIHAMGTSLDRSKVFNSNTLLNRTDLGFVLKQGEGEMLLLASSLKEPQPTAAAQVFIFPKKGPSLQLQTNEQGVLQTSTAEWGGDNSPYVVVQSGDNLAYAYAPGTMYLEEPGEGFSISGGEEGRSTFTFVYTDRPLYRPGQRVYFKGLVRKRTLQGTYQVRGNTEVDILVEDPRGNVVAELKRSVSEEGSFSGAFNLGEEAELGYYTLRSSLFGREYVKNFEVDEYRKPEFKIETTPGSEHYFAGDEITFLIDAQYFFGAPVEAEIDWTLYKSAYYYVPPGEGLLPDYWEYYGDEGYVGGYGEYLKSGKLQTDDKGHAKVRYETKESSEDFRYTLRMQARDISERQIEREASIIVTAGDFFFRTEREEFLAFPKKPLDLTVLTRNYENQPVSVKYKIEVKRQHWDPLVKKYEYKKVTKVKGQTDEKGRGVSQIVVPKGGYYHLKIQGKDSQGRKVAFTDYLWVSGSGQDSEDFGVAKELKVIPAKKHFEAGEEATLFVVGPERNGKVLLTIEGDRLFEERLIQLDGFSKEIKLNLKKEWIPNIFVQATGIGKKAIYQGETQLAISPDANFLQVKIEPGQQQYEPGDEITYHITTLDAKGQPVPAQLSLGVVDEKIYALRADKTDVKKFFWGPRPNQVATTYSFSEYYSGGIQKEDRNLLRRNFKDTAYWNPNLVTDENGKTQIQFKLPDNLTTWRATAIASTLTTAVGQEINKVISTKPLILRVAAPRFFTEKDLVYLKVILHNYTESEQKLQVDLGLSGLTFVQAKDEGTRALTIPAKTVTAFDFPVLAKQPGPAKIQALAKNDAVSDGVELKIPILPYGIADKRWAQGVIAASLLDAPASTQVPLALPPKSSPERSSLKVTLDTSFVAQLLGSLSYLVQYPYGCVEQTMSRLLPAIMVAKTSADLGLSDPLLEKKIPRVIKRGLARIYRMQNSGGGWGWFAQDSQDPFMTAYALYGLLRAQEMGLKVEAQVLKDAKGALKKILKKGVPSSSSYLFGKEGTRYFIYYVASLAGIPNRPP